jgi:hypothetical protein
MKRLLSFVLTAALVLAFTGTAYAERSSGRWTVPPKKTTFSSIAPNGFGDAQNSYAWSMAEFDGHVYVGTGRLVDTFEPMWEAIWGKVTPGQTPPKLPDVPFKPFLGEWLQRTAISAVVTDTAKYAEWNAASPAEIWRYDGRGRWRRVFRAAFVPSLLAAKDGSHPFTAAEITGLRSMIVYKDKNRKNALYASSGGFNFAAPGFGPKLIRSTNGTTWERLVTPAAMGSETRALAIHRDLLYAGGGGTLAAGSTGGTLWRSACPSETSSWTKVLDFADIDKSNTNVISIASFGDRVYLGTENAAKGFQVWRSKCSNPTTSTDFVQVIADGGGDRYNAWAGTLKVFRCELYVGSMSLPYLSGSDSFKGCDIFRIKSDDSYQLLVGNRKPAVPVTDGATRSPATPWPSGFGNPMNFYLWSMEVHDGRLYAGTFDASVFLTYLQDYEAPEGLTLPPAAEVIGQLAPFFAGSDLWSTSNGLDWKPSTFRGFEDMHNYGVRTLLSTRDGLLVGLNNPWDGCEVWKGSN